MSVSVNGPKTPITKGSNGIAVATLPNICKMPGPPAPFVPAPLPNIGKSGDSPKGFSKNVKIEKKTVAIKGASFKSMGDMASKGTGGGLLSANTHGPCKFISPGSIDVKFEGKNVHQLSDMVTNNGGPSGSPPNAATLMGAIQAPGVVYILSEEQCPVCNKAVHEDFKESPETQTSADGLVNAYGETEDRNGKRPWKGTMIGVVECTSGHKHAGRTNNDHRFVQAAEGSYHVMHSSNQEGTIDQMKEVTGNTASFKTALNQALIGRAIRDIYIDSPLPDEQAEGRISRNPPGACAAQKALVLALLHNCTPSAMTEKWFSPGRPAGANARPPTTAGPVRHVNMAGDLVATEFNHGDSVPPCETCNLLLPFLTCQEEKEEPCEQSTAGCATC